MNYKNFNVNLENYLKEIIHKEKNNKDITQLSIHMYYQGFKDAISLLTKTFKLK